MTPYYSEIQARVLSPSYASGMPRPTRQKPREIASGWPLTPSADAPAEVARRLALNLRGAMHGNSARWVETRTGVDHTVVAKVLRGDTWADLATIARLEEGLDTVLWPLRTPQGGPDLHVEN